MLNTRDAQRESVLSSITQMPKTVEELKAIAKTVTESISNNIISDFANVGDGSTKDITRSLKENVNRGTMETSSDANKESEATGNADTGEYDGVRETQLREAEKERLHGRGNQTDVVGNQEHTDRSHGGTYPNNEEKYNGEPANKGLVRGLFHGTPTNFQGMQRVMSMTHPIPTKYP